MHVVGGNDPARALHIDRDRSGGAGNMPRHVTGQQATVEIIAPPGARTDDDLDGLALVIISGQHGFWGHA